MQNISIQYDNVVRNLGVMFKNKTNNLVPICANLHMSSLNLKLHYGSVCLKPL